MVYLVGVVVAVRERFQSPRGDFGFLKLTFQSSLAMVSSYDTMFQSPRGDFGFLKLTIPHLRPLRKRLYWAICAVSVC